MARIVRWIHVSDWHVKADKDLSQDEVIAEMIKDISCIVDSNSESPGPFQPDFLAHTGDLAFSGKQSEYKRAIPFLKALISAAHLEKDHFFIVPGNHDIYDALAISVDGLPPDFDAKSYRSCRDEWYQRQGPLEDVLRRFRHFQKAIALLVPPDQRVDQKRSCFGTVLTTTIGARIGIIGITTPFISRKDDEEVKRSMLLGDWQIEDASSSIAAEPLPDLTIALMHHPLEALRHYDCSQCFGALTNRAIEVVLRGHLHTPKAILTTAPDGSAATIAAGTCYEKFWSYNGYVLGQIDLETRVLTTWFRRWEPSIKCFKPDLSVYKASKADGSVEINLPKRDSFGIDSSMKRGSSKTPLVIITTTKAIRSAVSYGKFGLFPGYFDLDSHTKMAERIEYELNETRCLETKYLFWHVDSRSAYSELLREPDYTIARQSESLFRAVLPQLAEQVLKIAKAGCTIVSLGTGSGIKEFWLLRELCSQRPTIPIDLVLLDLNEQMLKWALGQFRGASIPERAKVQYCSADFDRLAQLKPFVSQLSKPVIFLLLGGLFGNLKEERAFLRSLASVATNQTFLVSGFQTPEALAFNETLGGYGTPAGFHFLEVTLKKFDPRYIPERRRMKAIRTNAFPSDVPSAETISVKAITPRFGDAEIGFSRRYNPKLALAFIEESGNRIIWDSGTASKTYFKFLAKITKND